MTNRNRCTRSRHNSYGHQTQDRSVPVNHTTNDAADCIFCLVMFVLFFTLPYICAKVVGAI